MNFKEIERKLIGGKKYNNRLKQLGRSLYTQIYRLIRSCLDVNYSPELTDIIGVITEALAGIQAEALEIGYKAGITDSLQEVKISGIIDFDLLEEDFSTLEQSLTDLEIPEIGSPEWEELMKDIKF